MPKFYWEDFSAGQTFEYGPWLVTAADIKAFAAEFDPRPMHLGEDLNANDLCASCWHVCCIMMRIITDGFLLDSVSLGGAGCEEIKWLKPVRPDESLRVRAHVLATRASASRPNMGLAKFSFEVVNASDTVMMTATANILFARRGMPASQNGAMK